MKNLTTKKKVLLTIGSIILILIGLFTTHYITRDNVQGEAFYEYHHYIDWDDNYKDKVAVVKVPYNQDGVMTDKIVIDIKYSGGQKIRRIDINGNGR